MYVVVFALHGSQLELNSSQSSAMKARSFTYHCSWKWCIRSCINHVCLFPLAFTSQILKAAVWYTCTCHVYLASFTPRPCLIWHHGWAPRHRSAWTKYYQRYGRQPRITHLVPSLCCNLYTPSATCRSGWIAGRMPIWLFGTLPSRLQEAQMVIREARSIFLSLNHIYYYFLIEYNLIIINRYVFFCGLAQIPLAAGLVF